MIYKLIYLIKIDIIDDFTFLGLYLGIQLSFNIHIGNLNIKLSKILYLIKKLSYFISYVLLQI